MPALAVAQPVGVDVGVNAEVDVGDDTYDTVAPGDPVESVDVFYDQLEPYGTWVDEPDVGRVFIPDGDGYVPYHNGHWQYTNLGMVWVSSEPHAWATAHYGRWAWSNNYNHWYWAPDTEWGPAWVEWRQTGSDFGWAPLPPVVVVRAGWQPPPETWHYCGSEHLLDVNVTRYYEPRARVIEIHREARPIEHYSTVSNVRVVVGPSRAVLRDHRVNVRPVRVEARAIGRLPPAEAHAQVVRARERRATFEVENQRRIESHPRIHEAHVKVVETHPQIKAQVNVRLQGRVEAGHPEPGHETRPGQPPRVEPNRETHPGQPNRVEPNRPEPNREAHPGQPNRVEPNRPEPNRPEPNRERPEPRPQPNRVEPPREQPRPQPPHEQPRPQPHEPQPREQPRAQPQPPREQPQPREQPRPQPQPQPREQPRAQPQPPREQPREQPRPQPQPQHEQPRGNEHREPERREPEHH